jgi:hypothetical protein
MSAPLVEGRGAAAALTFATVATPSSFLCVGCAGDKDQKQARKDYLSFLMGLM